MSKPTFTLAALLMVAGCANQTVARQPGPSPVAPSDPVAASVAASASEVANAMASLAAVAQANDPAPVQPPDPKTLPPELTRTISLAWSAGASEAVAAIARQIGYGYGGPYGQTPNEPVVVLNGRPRPVYEVLLDIGAQIGRRGTVNVDAEGRRMSVTYAH